MLIFQVMPVAALFGSAVPARLPATDVVAAPVALELLVRSAPRAPVRLTPVWQSGAKLVPHADRTAVHTEPTSVLEGAVPVYCRWKMLDHGRPLTVPLQAT